MRAAVRACLHLLCRRTPCLVAHNGAMYDFVILKEEARRSLVQLPTGWAFVDTMRMAQVRGVGGWASIRLALWGAAALHVGMHVSG